MNGTVRVEGNVAAGFEPVADAFASNFALGRETGAACAVYVDGREVVDIWAGPADPASGRAWERSTIAPVYSTTKGVTAICAHLLAQRGELDLHRPVSFYWPEFAAAGKASIPVRMLLDHSAGLPTVDRRLTPDEVLAERPVMEALAAQMPLWEPGSRHGYHALTYGWLVGEVVRRLTGRSLGRFLAEEIAGPLGLDLHIGLPEALYDRVARTVRPPAPEPRPETPALSPEPESLLVRALSLNGTFPLDAKVSQDPADEKRAYAAESPGTGGIGDARSLARLYAACVSTVDGFRLLDDSTIAAACEGAPAGPDAVLPWDTRYGQGFWLPTPQQPIMTGASFGHPGMGGSIGFADPLARVGFGYVPNNIGAGDGMAGDPRKRPMISALCDVLGFPDPA